MRHAVLLLLLAAPGAPSSEPGIVVERTVRVTFTDVLNARREIHRKEVVRVRGSDLSVTDLTFGGRLIVRAGLKKVWKADPLAGTYSELTFDEVAAHRKRALDELRAVRARVPGTVDEKELTALLEGLDEYAAEPRVELRAAGAAREIVVNGDRLRASVEVDGAHKADGYVEALSGIGAFHPAVAGKLKELGGFPKKGSIRYVLFLDRVHEQFEATSIRGEEVADAEFELPPGLKRVPLEGLEPPVERKPAKPAAFDSGFKEDEVERKNNPFQMGEKKP